MLPLPWVNTLYLAIFVIWWIATILLVRSIRRHGLANKYLEAGNTELRKQLATRDARDEECSRISGFPGIERIILERERQIHLEGWTADHDDEHKTGELADAAACYAAGEHVYIKSAFDEIHKLDTYEDIWPFDDSWFKTDPEYSISGRIIELEKAGALCAAEIDRLIRLKAAQSPDFVADVNAAIEKYKQTAKVQAAGSADTPVRPEKRLICPGCGSDSFIGRKEDEMECLVCGAKVLKLPSWSDVRDGDHIIAKHVDGKAGAINGTVSDIDHAHGYFCLPGTSHRFENWTLTHHTSASTREDAA